MSASQTQFALASISSWGLHPRLYAVARFASFLMSASQTQLHWLHIILGLAPQALCCRSLRELSDVCFADSICIGFNIILRPAPQAYALAPQFCFCFTE